MLKFLRGLLGGGGGSAAANEPLDEQAETYKDYRITPWPKKINAGWSTEGLISKDADGASRSQHFIRADSLSSQEEAVAFILRKGRQIIDEQGDALFRDG